MKTSSIKTEIWRLILLPTFCLAMLLSGALSFFYVAKVNDFVAQHGLLLSEKTAHLVHIALNNNQPEVLESLIQATLDEPMVRAVHIYNASTDQHLHRGPRFNIDNTALLANDPNNQMIQTREGYRFRHPIITANKRQNLGWLDIELTLSSYQVNIYQILFIVFATTASCLLLAGFLANRLLRNIVEPLTNIQQVIDRLSKGHLNVRLKDNIAAEFKPLGDTVNTMADAQEHAQKNMQLHIDESMQELQETLETIEIQNVELDLARKEALAASHIKSEFLANTSHEIRTPLNGIIGFTNLALKTELNDDQKKYLQTIHNSAQNLTSIINDIFDFSKIESGKLELDYTSMSLRALAEATVATFAFETQEKNLQIVTIIDNNIPPQLMGDPQRFNQILANLLSNAIKFSQRGTICIEFTLENFIEGQVTVKGSVKDEGIGLSQEQQAQLFSAFSQADSSNSRKHGGAGLGLAICKGLVDRMKGEIGVESQLNKGAQFWFTATLGVDPNYAASEQNSLKNKRILICCENPLYYRQFESLVGSWQAKTLWLNAIHDIFTHLRAEHLAGREQNLVIIDIAPDERKFPPILLGNIAEQLALEFSCKVIVCCSNTHLEMFSQYDNSKSIEFVTKPIIQSSLLNAISQSLDVRLESDKLTQDEAARAKTKILLVDDNNANLQLTTELLRDLNVTVTQASSGEQAVSLFSAGEFDLIFMDIQMPGIDGMETTQIIRERETNHNRRTPIIALTAHTLSEYKTDLLIAGLDDCIRKPVSESQLAQMLNRWTGLTFSQPRPTPAPTTEPESSAEPSSPVNIAQCLALANHKRNLARDMLTMLLDSLEAEQQALNAAYKTQDLAALQDQAHKLYGSSCYTGVPHLRSITGLLDKILNTEQTHDLEPTMICLNNTIDQLKQWANGRDIDAEFGLTKKTTDEI